MKFRVSESFILTLLLVYNSTKASILAISPVTLVLSLILVLYLFKKKEKKIDKLFVNFSVLFFLVNVFFILSLPKFDLFLTGYIYLKFFYVYLSVKIIGLDFFKNIVKIGYYGSAVSLFFFTCQLINFDFTFKLVGLFQNSFDILSFRNEQLANNFLFTIKSTAPLRNSGFMWEPKGFANFLIISIFFHLVTNKFRILNVKFLVMISALITTFSTAGFLALFVLFIFYYLNKNLKILVLIFPIYLVSAILIFVNVDFLYNKIIYELSLTDRHEVLLYEKTDYETDTYSLGRTASFILDFSDWIERPFFGYGFTRENRTQSDYVKLIRVNGISDMLCIYGGLGLFFYFYLHHVFLKKLQQKFNFRFGFIFILVLLILYFGSNLTSHPLWMSLIFLSVPFNKLSK